MKAPCAANLVMTCTFSGVGCGRGTRGRGREKGERRVRERSKFCSFFDRLPTVEVIFPRDVAVHQPHRLCAKSWAHIARQATEPKLLCSGCGSSRPESVPSLESLDGRSLKAQVQHRPSLCSLLDTASLARAALRHPVHTWSAPLQVAYAFTDHSAQFAQPSPSTLRMPSSPCAPSFRSALLQRLQPPPPLQSY
ncbi:hypothetical protein L1887_50254 [Cichorium endivia]|nr:hypothetical protein L1887_50254 [Cichorium endivia]